MKKVTEDEMKIRMSQGSPRIEDMSKEDKEFYIKTHCEHIKQYYEGKRRYLTIDLE